MAYRQLEPAHRAQEIFDDIKIRRPLLDAIFSVQALVSIINSYLPASFPGIICAIYQFFDNPYGISTFFLRNCPVFKEKVFLLRKNCHNFTAPDWILKKKASYYCLQNYFSFGTFLDQFDLRHTSRTRQLYFAEEVDMCCTALKNGRISDFKIFMERGYSFDIDRFALNVLQWPESKYKDKILFELQRMESSLKARYFVFDARIMEPSDAVPFAAKDRDFAEPSATDFNVKRQHCRDHGCYCQNY